MPKGAPMIGEHFWVEAVARWRCWSSVEQLQISQSRRRHPTLRIPAERMIGNNASIKEVRSQNRLSTIPMTISLSLLTTRYINCTWSLSDSEIKYSNASQLRAQLREIAPMNSEGSKIFCPNGASAAVSPLMENKCGDRQALPSVYGRKDDIMGNSIPGFGGDSPSLLRTELDRQAYFRSN